MAKRRKLIIKTLRIGSLLGRGGFGSVFEATLRGKKYAVKQMHRTAKNPRAMQESMEAEKLILALKHPNIVQTFAVLETENMEDVLIIMEFAGSRNLQTVIDNDRETLDSKRRLNFACDITKALEAIHNKNIAHLDLKPSNIIVNSHDVCKLADFGCCQVTDPYELSADSLLPPSPTHSPSARSFLTGTFAYRAPELLKGEPATVKADIYSLGICLWQMLTREQPYGLESQFVVIFGVVANQLRPSLASVSCDRQEGKHELYIELITALWLADPVKRPNANQVTKKLRTLQAFE
ncbi:predicted protein [Nematostella vectensis]|uniref:non-specific serine/threonine protein kinase n=1 Tax=Nematostella vectensis TaxID=45351 RepID=A7T0A3_NEMVE|nr:predicted protein [Nematostella vectensis]|eukprot:XP_001622709.1 predicted protein [Nematostella vectensis]